jgi:ABC-type microcin C transport system permease subunit YejB
MADDKTKTGGQDRDRVAGGQDYEVEDFARKTGLSPDQVRALIKRHGNDRATLEREAARLR